MNVVVTGCAGLIGSHVCEVLLARGDTVVGVDNFNDYYPPAYKRNNVAGFENHKHNARSPSPPGVRRRRV